MRRSLATFRSRRPDLLGRAAASAAEGTRERAGAEAALGVLNEAEVDLADPRHADALRALVRLAHEAGRPGEAEPRVVAALRAHPDAAVFHEIHGLWLELRGAPEAREAYLRALELTPDGSRPLAGLGRSSLASAPEQAASLLEQACEADPADAENQLAAARALAASGEREKAEARLAEILEQQPWNADAARELAGLQLAGGPATERTLELAQRAVRFGGGAPALDLLARVHEQRNEPDQAADAAARARAVREKSAPGA
jgi:tetratricopeptide (TPR) repeat protein